jgi:hypothetical protein
MYIYIFVFSANSADSILFDPFRLRARSWMSLANSISQAFHVLHFEKKSMFSTATHCRKSSTLALCKHSEVSDKSGMQTCGRSNHLSFVSTAPGTLFNSHYFRASLVGWVVYSIDRYSIECKLQTHSTLDIRRSLFLLELKRKDLEFGTL